MTSKAAQQLGRKGGKATSKKYGPDHYKKLAEHMNKVLAKRKKLKEYKSVGCIHGDGACAECGV